MSFQTNALSLLLTLLITTPVSAEEPLIHYERTHSLVAHEDNSVRLSIFSDGRVEAHFPLHSPQAGTHRWRMTEAELDRMLDRLQRVADIDSASMLENLQARRSLEMIEVADADPVILAINAGARGNNRIAISSPEIWQRRFPDDPELTAVTEATDEIAEWMRQQARERSQ